MIDSQSRGKMETAAKLALSMAIVGYIFISCLVLLPSSPARDMLLLPVYKYWCGLGLSQGFAVFAPYVPETNTQLAALVTLEDGSIIFWEFPRMGALGILERAQEERYRKWWQDVLLMDPYQFLLPDAARFVARKFNDSCNPPQYVALMRFSSPIPPPPGDASRRARSSAGREGIAPDTVSARTIYVYRVQPEDLR